MVLTDLIQNLFELLTLLGGIFIIIYLASILMKKEIKINFINENTLFFGLLISLTATLGSLFYSEIMQFNPCKLCWFQRIAMYPQSILFIIAFLKKDKKVFTYSLVLSFIGVLIAGYHYLIQRSLISSSLPCAAVGYSESCVENFFTSFGYITIHMMALTAFVLLLILGWINRS